MPAVHCTVLCELVPPVLCAVLWELVPAVLCAAVWELVPAVLFQCWLALCSCVVARYQAGSSSTSRSSWIAGQAIKGLTKHAIVILYPVLCQGWLALCSCAQGAWKIVVSSHSWV